MEDIWQNRSVYLTSFWGWEPESFSCIGFTDLNDAEAIKRKTTDPFIMVVYVTKTSRYKDPELRGKVVGFYLVSHERGHRDNFTSIKHHEREPDKWQHALRATRAFSFLPEYRMAINDFYPKISSDARIIAKRGKELSSDRVDILKNTPYMEVRSYAGPKLIDGTIQTKSYKTPAGPSRFTSYMVGEPLHTEKQLYALVLQGDASVFLGDQQSNSKIYKIGLSMSPKTRLADFQKTLPETQPVGKLGWFLHRTTCDDGHVAYPTFESALAGEDAMKEYLGKLECFRGGEFYAATDEQFEEAWTRGREAALKYIAE